MVSSSVVRSGSGRARYRLWCGALVALVLGSCATAPPVPREPGASAAWLGGTPRVVVRLDALQVKAWRQVTQNRPSLRSVGERTRAVWLGFDLDNLDDLKRASQAVRIVLEGDFPKGLASMMLDWNSAWKKGATPGVWTNAKLNLAVSLPEEGVVAARRGDLAPADRAEGVLRDLNPKEVETSAVWISFWSPGQALFGETGARLLPVERLDVVLSAEGDVLRGPVILRFPDERSAAAGTVLLKLFGPQVRSRFGQDLVWTVEGTQVVGTALEIRQSDLQALADKLIGPAQEDK